MTLGTILSASFQVLRRNPRPTFGAALLIHGGTSLLAVAVMGAVTATTLDRITLAAPEDQAAVTAGGIAMVVLATAVPVLLSLVAVAVLQGIIVLEVARGTLGEKLRFAGLWRGLKGRLGPLVGWVLALTVAVAAGFAAAVAIVVLLVVTGDLAGLAAGVGVALLCAAGAAALWVWLGTKLLFVPSAIVLERVGLGQAIARSWTLVRGHFWRTFGIQLLVIVILNTATQLVLAPVMLAFTLGGALITPTGDPTAAGATEIVSGVVTLAISAAVSAVAAVVQSASTALLYLDLRMRKEGLDLDLQRTVELRAAGSPAPDPYTAPAGRGHV